MALWKINQFFVIQNFTRTNQRRMIITQNGNS